MTRIAVPSKGRLRESVLDVLRRAGYKTSAFRGANASAVIEDIEFIEMRPRDAAAWLGAGRLDAAFISTDTALENAIEDYPTVELGFSRSDMIVACRDDAPYKSARDLEGKMVATHLPNWTTRWFDSLGVSVDVVAMGGSLEGICAQGMSDAIVDLRETGGSLIRNSLHAIEEIVPCQAVFTMAESSDPVVSAALSGMVLRIEAAHNATKRQYLVMHMAPEKVAELGTVFPGLAAPTLLPLAGRNDLVAVHIVVKKEKLWAKLADLRALGASGIVALPTDAILE